MKRRVTITLDPEIHRLAKQRAARKKTTVSGLIAALLREENSGKRRDVVASMIGSASLRLPAPGSDTLHDALREKYLRP